MRTIISALLAATFLLAGCNTVRGVGQDLQRAGSAVENAGRK